MNKKQFKGRIEEATGKVKEMTGKFFDNADLQLAGKTEKNIGKVNAGVKIEQKS